MTDTQALVERLAGEAAASAHLPAAITAHPGFKAFRREFAELVARECIKLVEPTAEHRGDPLGYIGEHAGVDLLDGVADAIRQRFGVKG